MTTPTSHNPAISVDTQLPIKTLGRTEGLPSGQVHDLALDHLGRVWSAGPSGLACYDGSRVLTFGRKDGLSTHGLRALAMMPDDRLWIGTDLGVDVLERDGSLHALFEAADWPGGFVECILPGANEEVWLGAAHGLFCRGSDGSLVRANDPRLAGSLISALAQDSNGGVWATGSGGSLLRREGGAWSAPSHDDWREVGSIRALLAGVDGSLLVSGERGLIEVDQNGTAIRRLRHPHGPSVGAGLVEAGPVGAILLERDELWLGVQAELRRYRIEAGSWTLQSVALSDTYVNALAHDRFGNLWAATDNRGVVKVGALRDALIRPALPGNGSVFSIRFEHDLIGDSNLLIGGDRASWRARLETNATASNLTGLASDKVWDLVRDHAGRLWAATQGGLKLAPDARNPEGWARVGADDGLLSSPNRSLLERGDEIWVGTVRGLCALRFDGHGRLETREIQGIGGSSLGYVYTLTEDRSGSLWVGTIGNGLWRETPRGLERVVGPDLTVSANTYAITEDNNGTLCVLQDNRIVLIKPDGRAELLTETETPVSGWAAQFAPDGHLWVGGSGGLSEYDPKSGTELRCVNAWLGLSGWEFTTSRSLLLDDQRRLWCGLNSGLMVVDLSRLERRDEPPTAHLGRVAWTNAQPDQRGQEFSLDQGKWTLEIEVFAAWMLDEDSLRFRHRLLGFDPQWSVPTAEADLQYNSLPVGAYTLEVQAHSPLVGWGPVARLVTVRVRAPGWRSLIASARGWLGTNPLSARRLRRQNLMLEQRVRQRTLEAAAANEALRARNEDLYRLSLTDALTGAANRRRFDEVLGAECERASRDRSALALLLLDIDDFKGFNDAYGHPEGDTCLHRVASVLAANLHKSTDLVARYGGEEFAVILPNTDFSVAAEVAERLRLNVHDLGIPNRSARQGAVVTVSVGVAGLGVGGIDDPHSLIAAADRALYEAKRLGRNRVEIERGPASARNSA